MQNFTKLVFVLLISLNVFTLQYANASCSAIDPFVSAGDSTNAVMPDMVFWNIIDKARKKSKGDFARQKTLMTDMLKTLDHLSIVMFNNKFLSLLDAANNEKLYVAANLIKPNCEEECFQDFKSYIIGLGKEQFFKIVSEPDNLASISIDETKKLDGLQECASDAYLSLVETDIPVTFKRNESITAMPKWGLDAELVKKYLPQLTEKLR
jgi:hypothetical protein